MRQITYYEMRQSLLIISILTLTSCFNRKESGKEQDRSATEVSIIKSVSDSSQETHSKNDSLSSSFLLEYPTAVKTDTIRRLYTFAIQELLEKSSNILFFQNGRIRDIEEFNGDHLLTLEGRDIQGRIIIKSDLWPKFVKNIGSPRSRPRGGFIIKVLLIKPIQSETILTFDDIASTEGEALSEIDLSEYVHFSFETSTRPFYIITGELIDFYLL